jgi:hypothetical protein
VNNKRAYFWGKKPHSDSGFTSQAVGQPCAAMVQEAPLKIYARGVVSYFYFSRAPRVRALKIRQTNSAILKVPDAAWIR